MRIKKIAKHEATVWFLRDELSFMIATTERALKELNPEDFHTRTGRTVGYANAVLARLRVANGEGKLREIPHPHQDDVQVSGDFNDLDTPRRLRVTMRIELIVDDKALVTLSDYELCFLNNAINEAVHGLRGIEEFERAIGKTREYGDALMDQLVDANDMVEASH